MTFKSFMTGPWWPHSWIAHGVLKVVGAFDGRLHGIDSIDKLLGTGKYAIGTGLVGKPKKTDSTAEKPESKAEKARKEEEERQKEAKLKKKAMTQVERIKKANQIVRELYDNHKLDTMTYSAVNAYLGRTEPDIAAAENPKMYDKLADCILKVAENDDGKQLVSMAQKLNEIFKDKAAWQDAYHVLEKMVNNVDQPDNPFHMAEKTNVKQKDSGLSNVKTGLGNDVSDVPSLRQPGE